ncbi:MAG: UDP-N-acetylglucosamine 4,6-dehydratase (inverting) [Alphaproteobacteria bacterium]|nr:UDP-N-acetylglucosamine 4,6-dehydratase (inverting) [Alphaproteobacteria bacterium]
MWRADPTSRFAGQPEPEFLRGTSILVTGGTGSFGQAFVRTIVQRYRPAKLIVFSRDELKQFEMQNDPVLRDLDCMRFFIGDVRSRDRLEMAFREVDYVIHAAALKQIPAAEYNPFECIQTNVHGAENVVTAAIHAGVKCVIALSSDKAANPTNLYGASKLAADKIFVAARNVAGAKGPRFAVVRYGNVLGSRGSVIPFFRSLVAQGATRLPITDARMTRFWITLAQGVDFVLSCLRRMQGGEIFIPKIPSMRVIDLARCLAPDLEHHIVGIRHGEKLHEVMITEEDSRNTLEFDDRYAMIPDPKAYRRAVPAGLAVREVPEGFRYASDTNPEWLDDAGLRALLGEPAPA